MTDPIADMLTRIRNAQAVSKTEVFVPFSQIKYQIAKILEQEKFIETVKKGGKGDKKKLKIDLKYIDKSPVILGLKRISKPGQRIYLPVSSIKSVRGGFGIAIVSTSQGLITDKDARKKKLGGEIICEIW